MIDINSEYKNMTFDDVVGMDENTKLLSGMNPIPQVIIFFGEVGCGKNLLAYLTARRIGNANIVVRDSSDNTAAAAEQLIQQFSSTPLFFKNEVCILNEFHQFRKGAQMKFKDILQSPPKGIYFFVCSASPSEIIKDVWNRFRLKIKVRPLTKKESKTLIERLEKRYSVTLTEKEKNYLAETSLGIPRTIVYAIENVKAGAKLTIPSLERKDERLFYKLVRMVLSGQSGVKKILDEINIPPESIRYKLLYTFYNIETERSRQLIRALLPKLEPGAEKIDLFLRLLR